MGKFYVHSGKYKSVKNAVSIESALALAAREMFEQPDGLGELITINEHGYEGTRKNDIFFLTENILSGIEKSF